MTAEFNERGFHFLYPENWNVVREKNRTWPRSVSVHSPQGAFWTATIDQGSSDDLFDQVVALIRQEYDEIETEVVQREVGPLRLEGIEMRFYYLDLLVTAQVLRSPDVAPTVVLLYQGEDRDFSTLAAVFDAISVSLLQHLRAGAPVDHR